MTAMRYQNKNQVVVFLTECCPDLEDFMPLQQVLDIEQSMLLEAYTQFVSKVEQKPKESVEEAKKWMMGQLLQQGFQVTSVLFPMYSQLCQRSCIQNLKDAKQFAAISSS